MPEYRNAQSEVGNSVNISRTVFVSCAMRRTLTDERLPKSDGRVPFAGRGHERVCWAKYCSDTKYRHVLMPSLIKQRRQPYSRSAKNGRGMRHFSFDHAYGVTEAQSIRVECGMQVGANRASANGNRPIARRRPRVPCRVRRATAAPFPGDSSRLAASAPEARTVAEAAVPTSSSDRHGGCHPGP